MSRYIYHARVGNTRTGKPYSIYSFVSSHRNLQYLIACSIVSHQKSEVHGKARVSCHNNQIRGVVGGHVRHNYAYHVARTEATVHIINQLGDKCEKQYNIFLQKH